MFEDLIANAMQSTIPGFIGVSLIFAYFALIVIVSLKRIKQADHIHH